MSSSGARNHLGPQSTGDSTQYNVPNAALRGASLAFSKPPVKPKAQTNLYTGGGNGALLAATKVGTGTPRNSPSRATTPLGRDWTGGSARSSRPNASPIRHLSNSSSSSALTVPEDHLAERGPSPSNIAATLAAARHTALKPPVQATAAPVMSEREPNEAEIPPPPGSVRNVLARMDARKPKPSASQRREKAASEHISSPLRAPVEDAKPTDDTPIAPTTSLVKMFEQNRSSTRGAPSPISFTSNSPPPIRSPKPQRKINLPPEPNDNAPLERQKTRTPPPVNPKSKPLLGKAAFTDGMKEEPSSSILRQDSLATPPPRQKPAELAAIKNTGSRPGSRPRPPPKRFSRQTRPKSEDMTRSSSFSQRRISSSMSNQDVPSSPASFVSAQEEQEIPAEKAKPELPPPRRSARQKAEAEAQVRPKTATPLPPKPRASSRTSLIPPPQRRASMSGTSTPTGTLYHSNYQRESVLAITKHMTGESLSSAIVGAALASSRNASPNPSRISTPPIPIRKPQQYHHHSPFHHSPSPQKSAPTGKLRTTMRKEPSSSSEEDQSDRYKRKGTRIMGLGRKHPNKHHEGTRKRWRDQITERERKRYEGVWAANKGLFIQNVSSRSPSHALGEDPSLDVLNLVTKEIWMRSRLPEHELEEVWDLVDGRGVGRLRREEFVVGMWLVDQRLKGRKIPAKVSESVWASVRGAGVKIKVGPR
ncbi:hypothetical protein CC80DRAFT_462245 [Byssothecium circinans]|uniref:EH domain-containing protein n=1 Tax=Byssothecium circinans TaxID=147558 RepID=A0A6A5UC37_9PLEO|nr:hypothetical protein CC80DRAFT_462245 [Byssothecium circinans]